jgi:hypothetical protein
VGHIGDGRAGFCSSAGGEWVSILTPHKGEEANQTIFITNNWWSKSNFIMSGVSVPEARVIRKNPSAFTIMSDGCEAHSFECSIMDKATNKWSDPALS